MTGAGPSGVTGPILIAGGGIAGLATAIALGGAGLPVHVLEKRADFAEAGAGIQIGPNGVKALRALGVADALAPLAGQPEAICVRDARSGRALARLPLGQWIEQRHGAPYWTLHRADLHAALLARARSLPAVSVEPGLAALGYAIGHLIRIGGSDGRRIEGQALVVADGLWSTLRQHVAAGTVPLYAGRRAYRAVVPAAMAPPELTAATTTGLWLAPGVHAVHYPVRAGTEIALVLVTSVAEPPAEGWDGSVANREIETLTAGLNGSLGALLCAADSWKSWGLYELPTLPRWHDGRIVLTGDAAHPMLPFLAQGAVMALEDALALATAVTASLRDGQPIETAFANFEAERRPRVRRVCETARRNGTVYHLSGASAFARDLVLRATPGQRLIAGYDWLYGHDPVT